MGDSSRRAGLLAALGWLATAGLPAALRAQTRADGQPLQLGLLPITTGRALVKNYQPVRNYLQRELGRPVELVAARDFRQFHVNTMAGDYDLIVTASHLGRLAQQEAGFLPLARYRAPQRTLLVMARERPVRHIEELRGHAIAGPDTLTLAAIEAEAWLHAHGLRSGADYSFIETPTPPSAARAVLSQLGLLAVTTPQGLKNTPEALRRQLEVFATLPDIPSMMWLAHPRLAREVPRIKALLLAFTSESEEGRVFFDATGYVGLREVHAEEFRLVDRYVPRVREILGSGK